MLPKRFPPVSTVRRYFYAWRDTGLFESIKTVLVMNLHQIEGRTLCNWAGRSAAWFGRLKARMKQDLLSSARLFADETTAKVLAPGTGKTKTC